MFHRPFQSPVRGTHDSQREAMDVHAHDFIRMLDSDSTLARQNRLLQQRMAARLRVESVGQSVVLITNDFHQRIGIGIKLQRTIGSGAWGFA